MKSPAPSPFSFPAYHAQELEPDIYQQWQTHHCFAPLSDKASTQTQLPQDKAAPAMPHTSGLDKTFCIVIPPPNVTGSLHLGHAWDETIQDMLIRWHRMCGHNTLWLPGTDHAGIATQWMVERALAKKGTSKEALGREAFLEKVWAFKEQSRGTITGQLKRLGVSCDWSRERFTLDPMLSAAVRRVFVHLYEEGLIYRATRMVNWSCKLLSAISDLEVEYRELKGEMSHICYPFVDGPSADGQKGMVVATTRPETMLADGAVAVHPQDTRYQDLVGKFVYLPLTDRTIPIIADEMVDPSFGSGAVKITPAHDPNDFLAGRRHDLLFLTIMDEEGRMSDAAPEPYQGLDRFEARKKVLQDLETQGLLVKRVPHLHSVGHCSRSGSIIEPRISVQWFVKMKDMAKDATDAVRSGKLNLVPQFQEKTLFHWLDNIEDWCISRQLWWGHRIPAWYCNQCQAVLVSEADALSACEKCGSTNLHAETDVLDTWFSSGLWPFSTMGWPEKTDDMKNFYPTSVLVTGYDILFFWVARMVMLGIKFTGEVPFSEVLLHGLLRDKHGQKMSKTKGNGLNPLELIDQYGADALRFALAAGTVPGKDMSLGVSVIEGYRNFINKLWNVSRFVMLQTQQSQQAHGLSTQEITAALDPFDHWILSHLDDTIKQFNHAFHTRRFDDACKTLYAFVWHAFCDWYVEVVKLRLQDDEKASNPASAKVACAILTHVLKNILLLAHPIIPFATESLWQTCALGEKFLMWQPFPTEHSSHLFEDSPISADDAPSNNMPSNAKGVEVAETTKQLIEYIRNMRGENHIAPNYKIAVEINNVSEQKAESFEQGRAVIMSLGKLACFSINHSELPDVWKPFAQGYADGFNIMLASDIEQDEQSEKQRKEKEQQRLVERMQQLSQKLTNESFMQKAPEAVVLKARSEHAELSEKLEKLKAAG